MKEKLYGVVPPMITPFEEDGSLNESALRAVVQFEKPYVHGLFVCGTYGGGPLMNISEKKRVVEIVSEELQSEREMVVNVSATNSRDAVDMAVFAEKNGATRVASVPPFYYSHPMSDVLR